MKTPWYGRAKNSVLAFPLVGDLQVSTSDLQVSTSDLQVSTGLFH